MGCFCLSVFLLLLRLGGLKGERLGIWVVLNFLHFELLRW